jgi:uncharacterized membrane protein YheB (UPF0754 family)
MLQNRFDKSLVVNLICLMIIALGYTVVPEGARDHVVTTGFFGFSGAVTNWLAVHMLFERVPGLYGSGIIPLKFESFKSAIRDMVMTQFFTMENIRKFTHDTDGFQPNLAPIIEHLDYDKIYDGFAEIVMASKFGGMLNMFGGASALESMRDPFKKALQAKLVEMASQPHFLENITQSASDDLHSVWKEKIGAMVDHRLEELTPQMVKEIIQEMIRSHLGWLVVWGGVFGCLIGLVTSFIAP